MIKRTALHVIALFGCLLCFSLLMWGDYSSNIAVENIRVYKSSEGRPIKVEEFPYQANYIGEYVIQFDLLVKNRKSVNIIPDDRLISLSVNGKGVSLEGFGENELSDYDKGFVAYLKEADEGRWNKVSARLENSSNPTGFHVRDNKNIGSLKSLYVYLFLGIFSLLMLRFIKVSKSQSFIVLAGLAVCVAYLSVTTPSTRTFDVYEGGGHRDYIHYLIEKKELPPSGEGWEYHQPPLYYFIAAATKSVFNIGSDSTDTWAQVLALWFWVMFLVASMGAIYEAFKNNKVALLLASLALCLWPSGVIHSIRIGNDPPLYAFYALSFYFAIRWWKYSQNRELIVSLIWASLALITKSNALAIWAVFGSLILLKSLSRKDFKNRVDFKRLFKTSATYAGFFVVSLSINFSDNVAEYWQGKSDDWLLSNVSATINPALGVGNNFENYAVFDFSTYIEHPFINTWDDIYGRQYFWNFVARSSLSSEFHFEGRALSLWGKINGILLLVFIFSVLSYAVARAGKCVKNSSWERLYRQAPWILSVLFPLVLLLAYRIKVPLSSNTDFRYVYPMLVPLVVIGAMVWEHRGYRVLKILSLAAPVISILSVPWVILLV